MPSFDIPDLPSREEYCNYPKISKTTINGIDYKKITNKDGSGHVEFGGPCGDLYFDRDGET